MMIYHCFLDNFLRDCCDTTLNQTNLAEKLKWEQTNPDQTNPETRYPELGTWNTELLATLETSRKISGSGKNVEKSSKKRKDRTSSQRGFEFRVSSGQGFDENVLELEQEYNKIEHKFRKLILILLKNF